MHSQYHFNVNMYQTIPEGIQTLPNLLSYAKRRLELYEILQKYESNPHKDQLIVEDVKNTPFIHLLRQENTKEQAAARHLDFLSHWILRLAYSKYWEDRNVFISYEQLWFQVRFNHMRFHDQFEFTKENEFSFVEVSDIERLKIEEKSGEILHLFETYYKCRFWQIPDLVARRSCLLLNGFAYFTWNQLIFLIVSKLGDDLSDSMQHISKTELPNQLETLVSQIILVKPPRMLDCKMTFDLSDIDTEARLNFPLCMRFIHLSLRKKHHLKHCARLQYGLFLKGIGLTLNDSLNFWRDEFLQRMSSSNFAGSYTYSIKYNYGKVGMKKEQRSFNCGKIMRLPEEENQVHGCPFKLWDEDILERFLDQEELDKHSIDSIKEFKRQGKYCDACTCMFQAVNGKDPDGMIDHPNQYYWNSVKANECCDADTDIEDLFS